MNHPQNVHEKLKEAHYLIQQLLNHLYATQNLLVEKGVVTGDELDIAYHRRLIDRDHREAARLDRRRTDQK